MRVVFEEKNSLSKIIDFLTLRENKTFTLQDSVIKFTKDQAYGGSIAFSDTIIVYGLFPSNIFKEYHVEEDVYLPLTPDLANDLDEMSRTSDITLSIEKNNVIIESNKERASSKLLEIKDMDKFIQLTDSGVLSLKNSTEVSVKIKTSDLSIRKKEDIAKIYTKDGKLYIAVNKDESNINREIEVLENVIDKDKPLKNDVICWLPNEYIKKASRILPDEAILSLWEKYVIFSLIDDKISYQFVISAMESEG